MFTSWFRKQADKWFTNVLASEPGYLKVLRAGGFLERPEPAGALRRFVLEVIREAMAAAREAEKPKEAP